MLVFVLPLAIVFAAAAAGLPWTTVLRRRVTGRGGGGDLPTCGHCGYAVMGLETFICPECGSDLREVGIVRSRHAPLPPGAVGPWGMFVRVVGWKLAAFAVVYTLVAASGIEYYTAYVHPVRWGQTETVVVQPHSGAYRAATVTLAQRFASRGTANRANPEVTQRQVSIDLDVGPDRHTFVRDVLAGTNAYRGADGVARTTTTGLSRDLRAWMAEHGVKVESPQVGAEIDTIADAITQSAQQGQFWDLLANRSDRYFRRDSVRLDGTSQSASAPGAAMGLAATGVGLAGLAVIWLRGRRRLATALGEARAARVAAAPVPPAMGPLSADGGSPTGAPTTRTLSLMFSDVKDYTARTAGESRLGILDLVRRHRELVQPIVKRRGGRVVKSLGDGLLIAFESATDAVLAGVEIQAAAAAHSSSAAAERDRLELRVGVSTGEVALDGGDVFGDAVNLASRAQQQARAGDVMFTEATWATINRREVQCADAGAFELKGVAGTVRLYRAVPFPKDAPATAPVASESANTQDTAGKPAR
jgi:class 3 adenylate cyclase